MKKILSGEAVTMKTGSGKLVLTNEDVLKYKKAILIKHHTLPDDFLAIAATSCSGIVTIVGGMASHASIVAREFDKPCIINCPELEIELDNKRIKIGEEYYPVGTELIVDGMTGGIYLK